MIISRERLVRFAAVAMASVLGLTALSSATEPVTATGGTFWGSRLVGWGANNTGQLGNGQQVKMQTLFTTVVGGPQYPGRPVAGRSHSMATSMGKIWAWGDNGSGQLGDGTQTRRPIPVLVSGPTEVVQVAAGVDYSLALRYDGTVWAWGANNRGQLGLGHHGPGPMTPTRLPGLNGIIAITAGLAHNLAIRSDGTVWAWGENSDGQLGKGFQGGISPHPSQVPGLTDVTGISAGRGHSLALRSDGSVWAWGDNGSGQLGDFSNLRRLTPVQVSAGTEFTAVAAGEAHSLALRNDGTVWAWGNNDVGQLGDGTRMSSNHAVQTPVSHVIDIAAGSTFSFANELGEMTDVGDVVVHRKLWAWGGNGAGQLGDGTQLDRSVPVQVIGLNGVFGVCGGAAAHHMLAIKSRESFPPPRFLIGLTPGSGTLSGGGSLGTTVTIAPINGADGKITLSAAELPPGITAAFNPSKPVPGTTATLTLQAAPQLPAGSYHVVVTGTADDQSAASAVLELNIE